MAEPEEKPFYERHWFQGTVAVVGLVAAISAFVGVPKLWDVVAESSESEKPRSYTEIILDASAAMGAPFGDGTKLDAAVRGIERYVVPFKEEGLALRRTGGSCEGSGDVLVDFGRDQTGEVAKEAAEQQPEGVSNLAYAMIEAIGEFPADSSQEKNQIIIFTAAPEDDCIGLDEAAEEIKHELDRSGIEARFRLVALRPSPEGREQLQSFAADLGGQATFDPVESDEELEEAIEEAQEGTLSLLADPGDVTEEGIADEEAGGDDETGETGEEDSEMDFNEESTEEGPPVEGIGTEETSPALP